MYLFSVVTKKASRINDVIVEGDQAGLKVDVG